MRLQKHRQSSAGGLVLKDRDGFIARTKERGVPTSVHYPTSLHKQPVYAAIAEKFNCPESDRAAREVVSLPMWPDMSDEQVAAVIKGVRESVAEAVGGAAG